MLRGKWSFDSCSVPPLLEVVPEGEGGQPGLLLVLHRWPQQLLEAPNSALGERVKQAKLLPGCPIGISAPPLPTPASKTPIAREVPYQLAHI